MKNPKRPRDPNQLAKNIVDLATGETVDQQPTSINAYAVALGRMGGLVGGKARARKLSKEKRVRIAKLAARARWRKSKGG
jgi:hypothetical protein